MRFIDRWREVDAFVEVSEDEAGFEFREVNFIAQGGVVFGREGAIRIAAVEGDGDPSLIDDEVVVKRRNGGVGGEFFDLIDAATGGAEDFDEKDGLVLVAFVSRVAFAGDEAIGVVKVGDALEIDTNFGVAVGGAAGGSTELVVKRSKGVSGDVVVIIAPTGHGVNGASEVFMLDGTRKFSGEVVLDGDEVRVFDSFHFPRR